MNHTFLHIVSCSFSEATLGKNFAPSRSYKTLLLHGQVENAEVRKPKYMETEVRKPKCGSKKKSHLSVSSALLTHDCTLVGKGWRLQAMWELSTDTLDSIVH